jgi:hypothetical protein
MQLINQHVPILNPKIYIINTIGTQCCISLRNQPDLPLFDENLCWAGDCEYFARLIQKYGPPKILSEPTIVHYLWGGQLSNTIGKNQDLINKENNYILSIYEP